MLILISPAKSLDYSSTLPTKKHSQPRMLGEAANLVQMMRQKSPDDLAAMMGISSKLAVLNHERFNNWGTPFTPRTARPALLAFKGDVYLSMDAYATFDQRDYTQAQKVLRILSGLYGVLRPLDLIQPYRLEMGTKLATERGHDLYRYWGERITDMLNVDLSSSPGTKAVVNLASNEYFRSVHSSKLDGRLVTPIFLDGKKGGLDNKRGIGATHAVGVTNSVSDATIQTDTSPDREPRVISFFAKRARGAMASWIIRNRIKSIRGLQAFDGLGYSFIPERSTAYKPIFVRWS